MDTPCCVAFEAATVTTFSGAVMANLIFIPLAGKLEAASQDEFLFTELLIEGVICIQNGENSRTIEDRLKSFLAPNVCKQLEEGNEAAAA